ncbi:MAG: NAD(P)-binding domain-containing protein [Bacteroidota bacterium]|jgi:thioredoxin reductase (NADPH)
METLFENILIYLVVFLFCLAVVVIYLRRQKRQSKQVEEKIVKAKLEGLYEPVSLHPVVDPNNCIGTGACISACPEKDILGIRNGKATTINASHCIGHGACFHACPTQAITLCIGTEKRGVDLPHINYNFETNIPGIYIAGELGGMGLIKNAVEQGRQAVENIVKAGRKQHHATYDLIVVGAGPAGISAALNAKKHNLNCLTLEQDTLGGTVFSFPRSKIVMTSPMDIPLHGKVKLYETSKSELLELWKEVIQKNNISVKENSKVEAIVHEEEHFRVETLSGEQYTSRFVLLSIGRRGTPRKLNIPGEELEKVTYRLLEPEIINGKDIMVVGGGDSAIESALLLAGQNKVILSYRGDSFGRIKPKNKERIEEAVGQGLIDVKLNTNLLSIEQDEVILASGDEGKKTVRLKNDLVYIFAGGELPMQFLLKIGLQITKKFGEAVLKHR